MSLTKTKRKPGGVSAAVTAQCAALLLEIQFWAKLTALHWAADGVGHSSAMFPVRGGGGRAAGGGGGGGGGGIAVEES